MRTLVAVLILVVVPVFAQRNRRPPQQREVKIQKTSLSRDQELQLGKEAAAEVQRTMEVVKNPEIESWLNKIGQRLAQQPQANAYPYYFQLVNDESVNAFALPGGPMFVHTGLIRAADNESEVAGVLAHEMSHVALRHGAAQMSKAQTWQMIGGLLGAAAGMGGGGQCTLLCQAVQASGGLLSNSVLMKFSRDHERDADLNGARMMASAGYNPIDLATFFEKLEKQMGTAAQPKGLSNWFSSHPSPGNRVEYVSEDVTFYPKRDYTADSGGFKRIQQIATSIPPPKPQPGALLQPKQSPQPRQNLPEGYKDVQLTGFAIACPSDWQAGQAGGGGSVYIVPQGGAKQNQQSGVELILGGMVDYYKPQSGAVELQATTNELIGNLKKGDPAMQLTNPSRTDIGGQPGLMTKLTTKTSDGQEQVVYFYTVARNNLLWNLALAAPTSQLSSMEPTFRNIAGSVVFAK